MKKITCFIGSLSSGGAEHQMCFLTSFLAERGYNVTIITIDDVDDHYELDKRVIRKRIAPGKSYFIKRLSFMREALVVKADVVISWGLSQNAMLLWPLILRPDVRVICGERNYTRGHNSIWEKILYGGLYLKAKYIVANSYSQTEYEKQRHPFFASRMRTITNYADLEIYKYLPAPSEDLIRIGIFARCEEQKNLYRFIQAMSLVKQKSSYNFRVDWYGNHTFTSPSQNAYFESCIELINKQNLQDVVYIHDAVTNVPSLLPSFDVLCLPSLFEGFSNSVGEYICCGRPVICSDVSDNHVMVHNGENGFLFDPLSIDEIANSFLSFFSLSRKDKQIMCQKSKSIANKLFEKEIFVANYVECIED